MLVTMRARASLLAIPFLASPLLILVGCPATIREFPDGGGGSGAGGASSSSSSGGASSSSSSGNPPPTDIYVNPVSGDDTASGDQTAPLKTLAKALTLVQSGYTIHLLPGLYSFATNGDGFGYGLPDGVKIEGTDLMSTTFDGANIQQGLNFNGSGSLSGVSMKGFATAMSATAGNVMLSDVIVDTIANGRAMDIRNTADVTMNNVTLVNGSAGAELDTASRLTMNGGSISGMGPNCNGGVHGIYARDSASITLNGTTIGNIGGSAIELRQASSASLNGAVIDKTGPQGCGNGEALSTAESGSFNLVNTTVQNSAGPGILSYGTGQINLTDSDIVFSGWYGISAGESQVWIMGGSLAHNMGPGIQVDNYANLNGVLIEGNSDGISVGDGAQINVRGCIIKANGGSGIYAYGNTMGTFMDLGMSTADPGNNVIQANSQYGLYVGWTMGQTINALGNTWTPNMQGSDAAGKFMIGSQFCGPTNNNPPKSFAIANMGVCLIL